MDSYRNFYNSMARYQAMLRDREIENKGILVTVRRRLRSTTNEYGDSEPKVGRLQTGDDGRPVLADPVLDQLITEQLWCIPYYETERFRVNEAGISVEDGDVLEVAFRTVDFVPKDSEIDFPGIDLSDTVDAKTWVVAASKVKHTEDIFENVVKCVPKRKRFEPEYFTARVDENGLAVDPDEPADVVARSDDREVLEVDDRIVDYGDYGDDG